MARPVYSVVVPVFNEEESLPSLQEEIAAVMEGLRREYEVIYIDDKSTDNSLAVLEDLRKRYACLRVISLSCHSGQSAAFYAGFQAAEGEWVITLDADLQNDPADIARLVAYGQGYDIVQGIREKRKDSAWRSFSSRIASFCRRLVLGDATKDTGCSLRCFRRACLERNFFFFRNFHRFFPYLLQIRGCRMAQVKVSHRPRRFGRSKYTTARRLLEGIFDLGGVYWLRRRIIVNLDYEERG